MTEFRGGVRTRSALGFGASYPFGHLDFDEDRLRIWGFGMLVDVGRASVRAVRLSTGILATRVTVIGDDGVESDVYFAALRRGTVRRALREHGWDVIE